MAASKDTSKASISDLLKAADRAIKDGHLEQALQSISRVFEIDERNVYARAYRERILYLKESANQERQKEDLRQEEDKAAIARATEKRKAEEPPPAAEEPHEERAEEPTPPPPPPPPRGKKGGSSIPKSPATMEAYRTLLIEIWADGNLSDTEVGRIESMRETFAITHDEHDAIEREVRIQLYTDKVREAWQGGITDFDAIRHNFNISDREYREIEPAIMQMLQSLKTKGVVMVLDDDESFLNLIRDLLTDAGYYCYTAKSAEEGLKLLETTTPDIVICDINFVKPHMSGFAFYERFRSMERFLNVPFIFLSALDQDIVVRTGKQMGADDYLTKPFDAELLLATVEGKLKRARELRRPSAG